MDQRHDDRGVVVDTAIRDEADLPEQILGRRLHEGKPQWAVMSFLSP
jgi:hypothetical protein